MSLIINFGKYKDRSIRDLVVTDPSYCKWMLKQPFVSDEIKEYLELNISTDYTMNWGKHKNKSLQWIKANDEKYIEWLKSNEYVQESCPKLFEQLSTL